MDLRIDGVEIIVSYDEDGVQDGLGGTVSFRYFDDENMLIPDSDDSPNQMPMPTSTARDILELAQSCFDK